MPRCQNVSLFILFHDLKYFCTRTKGYCFKLCKKCCVFIGTPGITLKIAKTSLFTKELLGYARCEKLDKAFILFIYHPI